MKMPFGMKVFLAICFLGIIVIPVVGTLMMIQNPQALGDLNGRATESTGSNAWVFVLVLVVLFLWFMPKDKGNPQNQDSPDLKSDFPDTSENTVNRGLQELHIVDADPDARTFVLRRGSGNLYHHGNHLAEILNCDIVGGSPWFSSSVTIHVPAGNAWDFNAVVAKAEKLASKPWKW